MTVQLRSCLGVVVACVLLLGLPVLAQTIQTGDQAKPPRFEVASIKKSSASDAAIRGGNLEGATFRVGNMTVRQLLAGSYANRYMPSEIVGGPSWIDADRFDIVAKAPRIGSPLWLMMRTLLADRFHLRTHTERRDVPVYEMVFARSDHRLGPGLKRVDIDCVAAVRQANVTRCGWKPGPGQFVGTGVAMPLVIDDLAFAAGRRVIDTTALAGNYNIDLHWRPTDDERAVGSTDNVAQDASDAPSLFVAVQEQLGLKLVPGNAPVEHLVIDHVERPDAD